MVQVQKRQRIVSAPPRITSPPRVSTSEASDFNEDIDEGASIATGLDSLSAHYFRQLAKVVEADIGIKMPASKRVMVEGRLRSRVRALGLANLDDYAEFVFDRGGLRDEFIHIVDCVTTNKTDFFREPEHFTFLMHDLVPKILTEWPRGTPRRVKFWSAAASNGAEAFSLAMLLAHMAEDHRFQFSVLGTDICTTVLAEARRAIYPSSMLAPVPAEMRRRFVMQAKDPIRQEMRIVPELRRHVHFGRLNLMDAKYSVDRGMDVIFCRNILIYFGKDTQAHVVQKLSLHLKPGGYLFRGHSESMAGGKHSLLQQIAPTVFRRT
jgi:chemotaxis methyl-accepting protein methylase